MRWMMMSLMLGVVGGLLPACSSPPPASAGGFNSPNPAAKLYAIRNAGERKDRSAIPHLVERLIDDDPVVRLFAILALERITDERLGYNPYVSPEFRRDAVERWVEAVRGGRFSSTQ